jgi:hypothetical protein
MSDYWPEQTDFGPLFRPAQPAPPAEAGMAAAAACLAKAEQTAGFDAGRAREAVLALLADGQPRSGEELVDHCQRIGMVPHDARAFGAVIGTLSRRGLIEAVGQTNRRKGHNTAGATVWRITGRESTNGR